MALSQALASIRSICQAPVNSSGGSGIALPMPVASAVGLSERVPMAVDWLVGVIIRTMLISGWCMVPSAW